MEVIGIKHSEFDTKDGKHITGQNFYLVYPLGADNEGLGCERCYMTDDKLRRCTFVPQIGQEVTVLYNRYGKPENFLPVEK